jgi:hypothetical protein
MKKLIAKSFAILVGFLSGLSLSWLIGASMYSLMAEWNPVAVISVKLLCAIPALVGLYLAIRADITNTPFKVLLAREAALIGLSLWSSFIGIVMFLGGLSEVMPLLVPIAILAIAAAYLLCVGLIVGKLPVKPMLNWILLAPSLLLFTFVPVVFEWISQAAGYQKPNDPQFYSQLTMEGRDVDKS